MFWFFTSHSGKTELGTRGDNGAECNKRIKSGSLRLPPFQTTYYAYHHLIWKASSHTDVVTLLGHSSGQPATLPKSYVEKTQYRIHDTLSWKINKIGCSTLRKRSSYAVISFMQALSVCTGDRIRQLRALHLEHLKFVNNKWLSALRNWIVHLVLDIIRASFIRGYLSSAVSTFMS